MEDGSSSSGPAPRKMKFAPKIPPRRVSKPVETKTEESYAADAADAALTGQLLKLVNEGVVKRGSKIEKKAAPVQVAFGYADNSTSLRSFGAPRSNNNDTGSVPAQPVEKEYVEPWDYYSYYPTTLPLRRPYSGNPELLNEAEFGERSSSTAYDESSINPAKELNLMEAEEEERMLFFQLPATLPLIKRSATAKGKEIAGNPKSSKDEEKSDSDRGCTLEELPAGFMGKMLVYKSGKIKMKLGETLFDVSPGMECIFAQDIAVINTGEKHCCILGELNKRAIVTPDVDYLLDSITNSM